MAKMIFGATPVTPEEERLARYGARVGEEYCQKDRTGQRHCFFVEDPRMAALSFEKLFPRFAPYGDSGVSDLVTNRAGWERVKTLLQSRMQTVTDRVARDVGDANVKRTAMELVVRSQAALKRVTDALKTKEKQGDNITNANLAWSLLMDADEIRIRYNEKRIQLDTARRLLTYERTLSNEIDALQDELRIAEDFRKKQGFEEPPPVEEPPVTWGVGVGALLIAVAGTFALLAGGGRKAA